jgi:hypothetical protein
MSLAKTNAEVEAAICELWLRNPDMLRSWNMKKRGKNRGQRVECTSISKQQIR